MAATRGNGAKKTSTPGWHWPSLVIAVTASVVSGAAVQALVVIRWTGALDEKLSGVEQAVRDNRTELSKIDIAGSRAVPILQEKVAILERSDLGLRAQIDSISTRLDNLINQINRLDTPLAKKVQADAELIEIIRTALADMRNRDTAMDTEMKELRKISDQRQAVVDRAAKGFADIAQLQDQVKDLYGRLDRVNSNIEEQNRRIAEIRSELITRKR